MIRTALLAVGAAVALAAPALGQPPAFAPIGYGAHGVVSICGFNLGRGATPLNVPARSPLAARALGRTFATAAAAQRAFAVNSARLRTCDPIQVSGVTMVAAPGGFPVLGDARAAGQVTADGEPLGNVVFVRRGRSLAAIAWLAGRYDLAETTHLVRSAIRHLAP
jgi:hypothetical protein